MRSRDRSPCPTALTDYLRHCSMHGVRYIVEEGRHWSERLLWAVGVLAGLVGMVLFMREVWQQVAESPTVVSVASTEHYLLGTDFPAVTICSVNKVQRSAATRFYHKWGLQAVLSAGDFEAFVRQLAGLTQPERFRGALPHRLADMTAFLAARNLSLRDVMLQSGSLQLAPSCESLMVRCLWRKQIVNCSQLFTRQKSDAGFCCSFNYNTDGPLRKVEGEGYTQGLTVLVDPLLNDYYVAAYSFHGLQVLVHSPVDYPFVATRSIIVRPRTETFIQRGSAACACRQVDVTVTESAPAMRGLQPSRRPCLFGEDPAARRHGPRYSAGNCLLRCRSRLIHDACGCAPYHYLYTGDFNWLTVRTAQVDGHDDCLCRPLCDTVSFHTTVTSGDLFNSNYDYNSFFGDVQIVNQTILHVYLQELLTLRYRRDVLYNWNSLIGSLGGSAGLFLGCSLLSVLELLYFVTLRALCAPRRRRGQPPQPRPHPRRLHHHHVLPV
ncbi:pickpocket protein 28-like [Schistocerca piceifrons]|uniref:pickpocket protein 28-like n=1 Tax=Schistocerca piceifrons TaxID=274613 RepID=UPI001F5E480D|nr:pickpocket protein 28-like [Schistocerca piceifrons]